MTEPTTTQLLANARIAALEAQLAAFREAGLANEDGSPIVKGVLGTPPVTKDGYLAGVGCELWGDFSPYGMGNDVPTQCTGPVYPCVPMTRLYGKRESAEAALAAKGAEKK